MRTNKEVKKNKGFRRAFVAGSLIIIILSLIISWITVSIIRGLDKKLPNKKDSDEQVIDLESLESDKDTVFIEKIKEVKKTDTVYRYIQPPKARSEESHVQKRDTASK